MELSRLLRFVPYWALLLGLLFCSCDQKASRRWEQYRSLYANDPELVSKILAITVEPWEIGPSAEKSGNLYRHSYGTFRLPFDGEIVESSTGLDIAVVNERYRFLISEPTPVNVRVQEWHYKDLDAIMKKYDLPFDENFYRRTFLERPRTRDEIKSMTDEQFDLCFLFSKIKIIWCGFAGQVKEFSSDGKRGYLLLPDDPPRTEIIRAAVIFFIEREYEQNLFLIRRNASAPWNYDVIERVYSVMLDSYEVDIEALKEVTVQGVRGRL